MVQAQTVASTLTALPAAKSVPSRVETLRRSFDSSEWKVPEVPSAQEPPIVLGWLGSGPLPSRPRSRDGPESHELPTAAQRGARNVASKSAVWGPPPPPAGVTVSETGAPCVSEPEVPVTWKEVLPAAAEPETLTVRVLLALPLAGGVTEAGLKPQVTPAGSPVQARPTAEPKALTLATVTVVVPAWPWAMLSEEGEAAIVKSGVAAPPHDGNLNEPMRVLQLNVPDVFRYSFVYQNVQSSTGSMVIAL